VALASLPLPPSHARPVRHLALASLALGALLAPFVLALPLWATQPARPPASASFQPDPWGGFALATAFVLAVTLPFRPYHLAQRCLKNANVATPLLLALLALPALMATLIYPTLGSDIFDYVGFERAWVVYGDNPLSALPLAHPGDWASQLVWYPDRTPAYGPLWSLLTWPIVRLAGESAAAEVAGYKILSIGAYAACCWLIWTSLPPTRRQRALVGFAWSPLVLLDVLGKVHNDILTALAMLAMLWLLARPRAWRLAVLGLVAGGLVKVTALAALPAACLYLFRGRGWRALASALALGLALAVATIAPFWQGLLTLAPIWNQTSRLIWSPVSLLALGSAWLPGPPEVSLIRAAAALTWLVACWMIAARADCAAPTDVATKSGWLVVLAVLLLTGAVYAHYLVAAVALAAVSQDARLERLVVWLSVGAMAAYGVDLLGLAFGPDWLASDAHRAIGSLVLLGPATVSLIVAQLPRAWRRRYG
jgi:hypothetical protein